jgi:hypothetical protein
MKAAASPGRDMSTMSPRARTAMSSPPISAAISCDVAVHPTERRSDV